MRFRLPICTFNLYDTGNIAVHKPPRAVYNGSMVPIESDEYKPSVKTVIFTLGFLVLLGFAVWLFVPVR